MSLRRALSFSQLSECNSTKMTELDCVHRSILGQSSGCPQYNFSEISWEVAHKGPVVEVKKDAGNGLCHPAVVRLVSPPRGPPCLSPWRRCRFQCAFHSLGCLSKWPSLFPLWALLPLEPRPSSRNMCLRLTFGSLAPHLEWISAGAFSQSRPFSAFGDWKAVLNTLSSKSC